MSIYTVPDEFYFRIHHVRPRFKNNVEEVLYLFSSAISNIGRLEKKEFISKLNNSIRSFPGNGLLADKTINNWRTEISALFGFIMESQDCFWASQRALELAKEQDLISAFKKFLYTFQYPGGHVKPQVIAEQLKNKIRFKPAKSILKVLYDSEKSEGRRTYLTKAEVCHCIFNDLRCTSMNEAPLLTWKRIMDNRRSQMDYDERGDVIRYAGDIIDYMEIAGLLFSPDGKRYFLNPGSKSAMLIFCQSKNWFNGYDNLSGVSEINLADITKQKIQWLKYVNQTLDASYFKTELSELLPEENSNSPTENDSLRDFINRINQGNKISTVEIGTFGETLIFNHECNFLKQNNAGDLVHLVKHIPTSYAAGYDIKSVGVNRKPKHIEVKTTISMNPLNSLKQDRVRMTTNEWVVAESERDIYYIYRLIINRRSIELRVLQNPVGKYKQDLIEMIPIEGADILFTADQAPKEELLL